MTVLDTATVSGEDGRQTSAATTPASTGSLEPSHKMGLSRRQMMFGAGGAAAAFGLLPAWSRAPELASGYVFHDRSGSGQRRFSDPGIAGVLVSNGRDVVRTDEDGRWQLALRDGDSVFVIKPSGWSTPLGPSGVPTFSYLHQPTGSPLELNLQYPGVAPTGAVPRGIDFPLRPAAESNTFEALMMADPQPQTGRELSYLSADLAATAMKSNAAFAIVHGDIAFDDLTLYPRYLDIIGSTGLTWHHCPGNHDMNAEATDSRFAFETWKRTFGPCHYAFQHAQATFIILNNVSRVTGGERNYGAEISPDQLAFVRNVLAHVPRDQLIVLSMHIPLMSRPDVADPVPHVTGTETLMRLLSSYPHTVSFSGHTHTAEHHYLGADQGFLSAAPHHHNVLATASGSWWGGPLDHRDVPIADCQDGSPRGHHVLEVEGNRYTTRFVAASRPADTAPMRISIIGPDLAPGDPVPQRRLGTCRLVANVFDGGPKTSLSYEIARVSGGPRPMQREAMYDPSFVALQARPGASFKSWVTPVASSHIWTAPLPENLAPGAYRLSVMLIDEYGRSRVGQTLLEVAVPREDVHA